MPDRRVAELVEQALQEAGLDVFDPARVDPGSSVRDTLWRALAESAALVVVVPRERGPASNTAVELGAAMAWHKPIDVVHPENRRSPIPDYLSEYPAYPVSRVDDIVQSIRRSLRGLSEEQRAVLVETYSELGLPSDKLLGQPADVERLAHLFNARCKTNFPGERLVHELMRLRKRGDLPRLRKA